MKRWIKRMTAKEGRGGEEIIKFDAAVISSSGITL